MSRTPIHRKRCRRDDEPGHAHALTFSCSRRLPLLSRDRTRRWLVEAIEEARSRACFDLWAYVIMPEHAHLLLWPGEPTDRVSEILWRIKRPVGRRAIAFLEREAPDWLTRLTVMHGDGTSERRFWQAGGGYDRNLVDPKTALRVVESIHRNPVRRGLVGRPEDWEWSSARWYAGFRPVPLEIDPTLPRVHDP
ncbi:REP-associated tyrosine transposase [Tautonia plasticadhaerens]|uniref:Transposase IS200 like protein n=1 Tax=Tautonia plasticadhaerens TaxID=2527974 RepID=A0A518HDD0_9BACT|nr:transposase [Tautonia plasticadhaerens]QDV38862.1 Transposase IS200 like protein [Tautonia plasticadhaerens]